MSRERGLQRAALRVVFTTSRHKEGKCSGPSLSGSARAGRSGSDWRQRIGSGLGARAIITNLLLVGALHPAQAEHLDQASLLTLIENDQTDEAFAEAFEHGDELFETTFNAVDGVGANVGQGQRFTHVPRADLRGPGEWALQTGTMRASDRGNDGRRYDENISFTFDRGSEYEP